jgi:hypothetical protein
MTNYLIDYSTGFREGGYCQVYPIKKNKKLVFKEFYNKKRAEEAYGYNKLLAEFDLAPKIYSKVCRLHFADDGDWRPEEPSDWGYISEYAKTYSPNNKIRMSSIQKLVNDIYNKTQLKFWDCHWYNVGLVSRGSSKKLVCIDTGKESFSGIANAWGFADPGPKCSYCNKYQCKCTEE